MKKTNLRMLALGFLISAAILLVFNLFSEPTTNAVSGAKKDNAAGENNKTWKAKYESLLAKQELEKTKANEAKKAAGNKKKADEKKANEEKKYTLTIEKGDPSSKAGEELQANGIIKDAKDFDKFLHQNDYEKYIRDGKYDLSSKMTYEQIAKKLAHK